jgi:hypothetical protein
LGNIKNVPKHQPGRVFASQNLMLGCCGYDRLWARYFVKIVWCYVGSEQTICEVVLTGNKSMVRQGTEWYARTPGWLPGPCSWNPWRKRFNQRPLGKVMTFGIRWSCSLTKSLFCGWTPRSVAGYGWLNPTIYIYIYIALIVKINITHTHFLHVTLTHAEITPVFAGKKVMLIFQHLVQHLKSWLVESPHLHKTI